MIKSIITALTITTAADAFAGGNMSNLEPASLGFRDFCEETALNYVHAYDAGEQGLIEKALSESTTYATLDPFQRAAFKRLVGDLFTSYSDNRLDDSKLISECETLLVSNLDRFDEKSLDRCENLYWIANDIIHRPSVFGSIENGLIGKMKDQAAKLQGQGRARWPDAVFYECLRN